MRAFCAALMLLAPFAAAAETPAVPAVGADRPAYQPQALPAALAGVGDEVRAGRDPVAVFDLDDTLFDSSYRDARIVREVSGDPAFRARHPAAARALARLALPDFQHRWNAVVRVSELPAVGKDALDEFQAAWKARFFSDAYIRADEPVPGAPEFVRAIAGTGAIVVYLTGRLDSTARAATEWSLRRYGFPAPDGRRVFLLMKDTGPEESDAAFKDRVLSGTVDALGPVEACFENEPKNLNVFAARYPRAALFLVDTKHSPAPDEPDARAAWIRDFR